MQTPRTLLWMLFLALAPVSTVAFVSPSHNFKHHPWLILSNDKAGPSRRKTLKFQAASGSDTAVDGKQGEVKDILKQVFNEKDSRPVILFDGVCNLCNGGVNFALDWDPQGHFRFAALQSSVGRALLVAHGREPDDISTIVLVTENGEKAYFKSDAILRIAQELTPPSDGSDSLLAKRILLSLLPVRPVAVAGRLLVPRFLRDVLYDGVANNRYRLLGKRDQCRCEGEEEFDDRFVHDTVLQN